MSQPTAIVFGVGTVCGAGGAVCRRFAREGHYVIVAGCTSVKIHEVMAEIARKTGKAVHLNARHQAHRAHCP